MLDHALNTFYQKRLFNESVEMTKELYCYFVDTLVSINYNKTVKTLPGKCTLY